MERAVKHAIDPGHTQILMIPGSHAFDLKRGSDQMPRRFDEGGDYTLLPMDFAEFQLMRAQAGWQSKDRLDELRAFLRIGGFPPAVAQGGPEGKVSEKVLSTYWKWLRMSL